ncbi:MAG: hypothetical protein M1816_003470 [Peltula sp. TS41687]|nr:MAG: hypothetical protein M1816_003470 [Peltula sp. TS41687]
MTTIEPGNTTAKEKSKRLQSPAKTKQRRKVNVEKLRRKKAKLVGLAISMILEGIAQKLMSLVRAITTPEPADFENELEDEAGRRLPGNPAVQQFTRRIRNGYRNHTKQRGVQYKELNKVLEALKIREDKIQEKAGGHNEALLVKSKPKWKNSSITC